MTDNDNPGNTHFGFQQIPLGEKAGRVAQVFDSVAPRYDLMNDLMSFGLHRLWKRFAILLSGVKRGDRVLDLAGGTGDLARLLLPRVTPGGGVVMADINASMLEQGRARLLDEGLCRGLNFVQADAERLPFTDASFECVTIAFGLRNVSVKERALQAMYRVLKPGGRLLVLEFSRPNLPGLQPLYDRYSFDVLPTMGRLVAGDADSYRYLAESIRMHPDQETLRGMMETAGFERCQYYNLSGGIVAAHRGYRF